jgi:ribosome-associated translation inhibitor RaiA
MHIQFNTDESVDGHEALGRHAEEVTRKTLDRFSQHVTRIEIHLTDVNGDKTVGDDKRCLMEARIAGRRPVSVSENAQTLHQAVDRAAQKMSRRLDNTLGRVLTKRRSATPISGKRGEVPFNDAP